MIESARCVCCIERADLVYSGKYQLTDIEPETGMTVGQLVPTAALPFQCRPLWLPAVLSIH